MTQQPKWETVFSSDSQAIHVDQTGVYRPEMTIVEDLGESASELEGKFLIYRFPMDKCSYDDINDILSDNEFHPEIPAWFASAPDRWNPNGKLYDVAHTSGLETWELIRLLTSDDVKALARGYDALVSYFGPDEFDHYGGEYKTEKEAHDALS